MAESSSLLQIKKAEYFQAAETKERQAHAAVQEAEYLALAKAKLALAKQVHDGQFVDVNKILVITRLKQRRELS